MLSRELLKKISRIHLKASKMVNSVFAGEYRSVFRGKGIEFEEVREYTPGDEIKSIDWKVSARMGRPFVRRYREERELTVIILVDMSDSGFFGTSSRSKRETILEAAAVLAFAATKNNDRVGAILFSDRVEQYIPPRKGVAHVWRLIREILSFEPQGRHTDLNDALRFLGKVQRRRTITFVISDFLVPDFEDSLKIVSRRHELIGVTVSDPGDFCLPSVGILDLEDLETEKHMVIDASDSQARRIFDGRRRSKYAAIISLLRRCRVDIVELSTDGSVVEEFHRFFRYREARRR